FPDYMIGMRSNRDAENNGRLAIMETRACAECGASLPSGVTDVFCPACALRGALAGGSQPGDGTLLRWCQRLTGRKQEDTAVASLNPPGRDGVLSGPAGPVGPGVWETSGIIDAEHFYGRNSWLFSVQAHPTTTAPAPN